MLGRIGVQGQVVGQNELALYSTLFETHDQASLDNFLEATIGALLAHDRKRGSELAATLLRYFDCNQNAKTTAQRLRIHVNTVRQRLATIEDLLGHWGNASRALEIHIALRLWSLGTPVPDTPPRLSKPRSHRRPPTPPRLPRGFRGGRGRRSASRPPMSAPDIERRPAHAETRPTKETTNENALDAIRLGTALFLAATLVACGGGDDDDNSNGGGRHAAGGRRRWPAPNSPAWRSRPRRSACRRPAPSSPPRRASPRRAPARA